jgi:hypothetical protein
MTPFLPTPLGKTKMPKIGQICFGIRRTLTSALSGIALFVWSFAEAIWQVLIVGKARK